MWKLNALSLWCTQNCILLSLKRRNRFPFGKMIGCIYHWNFCMCFSLSLIHEIQLKPFNRFVELCDFQCKFRQPVRIPSVIYQKERECGILLKNADKIDARKQRDCSDFRINFRIIFTIQWISLDFRKILHWYHTHKWVV